jgi:hypothetical protein
VKPVRKEKEMRRRLLARAVVAASLVLAAGAVPLAASSGQDHRLVIGIRLDFVSPSHAVGTFAACCAVNDSGTASVDVTSFNPKPNGDEASFEATNTYVGSKGSFTILLRGVTGPLDSLRHVARAHWRVIAASGDYADLRGEGQLSAVTDENTGALTATADGEGQIGG